MRSDKAGNNLDAFFEVIDSIEDDISEMLDKNRELGGYECLVISFNCLTLFCRQVGIDFSQFNDLHGESKKTSSYNENLKNFVSGFELEECSEVELFDIILEEVESALAAFEKRCKKTEELFDEWNCVFIMYAYLRTYCDKTKFNYDEVMDDVFDLQSNLEKD